MEIETKRASLDTMAVTIQALHVDGKQMTLAVFRQLPETWTREEVYDPWGYVRHGTAARTDVWIIHSVGGVLHRYKTTGPFDSEGVIKEMKADGYRQSEMADGMREARLDHKVEWDADRALLAGITQLFIAV
ncbi:MAG: hypothetical protein IPJ58_16605 [Ardenticatenia bacterium]|nr:hypothetical protein [Ardenticatenia bacterium]